MTPEQFYTVVLLSSFTGVLFFAGLSVYFVAEQLWSRAVWKDDATAWGKARTTVKYVYRNAKWKRLPGIVARGAAVGALISAGLCLVLAGFVSIFLS